MPISGDMDTRTMGTAHDGTTTPELEGRGHRSALASLDPRAVAERIHRNGPGFVIENRWAIAVFVAALLADAASTTHFMVSLGTGAEMHPVVRAASAMCGPFAGPLIGALAKAVVCVGLAVYLRPLAVRILLGVAGLYLFAAWYNVWGIYWCI